MARANPTGSLEEAAASILSALQAAVQRMTSGVSRMTVLYSGGVDSSLVAKLLARRVETDLMAIGLERSPDLVAAESGAKALDLTVRVRTLSTSELPSAVARWSAELDGTSPTARSVALGTAIALEEAPQTRVACGQGADELFYGYAHFAGRSEPDARRLALEDWDRLTTADWPRVQRIARSLSKELVSPFLDPEVVDASHRAEFGLHFVGGTRKSLLREVARVAGVPRELCDRPKRAFQYGTRIHAALRKMTATTL